MSTDNWFAIILFAGVYISCLLLLDGAHRSHIAALKAAHWEQVAGLRSYIRTLSRERLWLEGEVQRLRDAAIEAAVAKKLREREQVRAEVDHIQWMPLELPPSEEYGEGD